jgi:hypothetical protein
MTVLLSPVFNIPFITDVDGNPLAGGKIFAYEAGSSSILQGTFNSSAGDVANANPIVLNSGGQPATEIWLTSGLSYHLVLTKADGTTVLAGFDDVTGIPGSSGGGGGVSNPIWVNAGAGTYVSPTQFIVPGNQVASFSVGTRVRLTLSSGFTYGVITAVSFSSPNTQVTIINDGVGLNSSLSVAEYSLLIASQGETVDAAGVSFFEAFNYAPINNTVGWKIKTMETTLTASIATTENQRVRDQKVWDATGTGTLTLTPSPAITSYSTDQRFTIRITNAQSGACTININGVGPASLSQYNSSGVLSNLSTAASQVTDIAYNGASWVLLDPLPPSGSVTPRGRQIFTSNGTFTVPAGVSYLKVTCVGGGGGGGYGTSVGYGEGESYYYWGGGGGGGANVSEYLSTSGGTTYSVGIGAGGNATGPTNGGTSSFGVTLVTAAGGIKGADATYSNGAGGAGGSSGTGFVIAGTPGATQTPGSAAGFGATYGYGGQGGYGGSFVGNAGNPGTAGIVIVEW